MPPWKAAEGYGEFQNVRRLDLEEIGTISRWVAAGAPEGDPADLPAPRPFTEGWRLGTPDVVLDAGADFPVRADGGDFFREFVVRDAAHRVNSVPFNPKEDVWVSAMEVVPGRGPPSSTTSASTSTRKANRWRWTRRARAWAIAVPASASVPAS
jgi:hypothetical protein